MTVFTHVGTHLKHNGEFAPRIPSCRHQGAEDDSTLRVSVGLTLDDCFTAIPGGGGRLDELNIERRGYYWVYKIDTKKLGMKEDQIVSAEELYEKDLVRDANFTNEHWIINKSFTVPEQDRFMIRLVGWQESPEDVIPHALYQLADEEYEGDYCQAYEDQHDENVPCSIRVFDMEYIHEEVKNGQEVSLYYEFEEEKAVILAYIEENLQAEVTDISMDEITFVMKEDANLRPLFRLHADVAMLHI
jgi:hypothetical protein